jgi:hypothetical protein
VSKVGPIKDKNKGFVFSLGQQSALLLFSICASTFWFVDGFKALFFNSFKIIDACAMEITSQPFVFQTDSPIVKTAYLENDNFLIEYDDSQDKKYCAIYFCSNNIYYPNTEDSFKSSILDKNKYEWYGTRVKYAHKHIFIRDIHKQWYLTGVNGNIDCPEKLFSFLQAETKGYQVVTLGSSAGGFAAVLYGSLLKAQLMLSFNGQFEIQSLLKTSTELVNPILFRFNKNKQLLDFFNVKYFIKNAENIFYFYSIGSDIDSRQKEHIPDIKLNTISFKTSHHGVPFLKCNLPAVLAKSHQELMSLSGKAHSPLWFSINMVGINKTVKGFLHQINNFY